jgi:hypothetical protein
MTLSTVTRFRAKVDPWEGDSIYYELRPNLNHITVKEAFSNLASSKPLNLIPEYYNIRDNIVTCLPIVRQRHGKYSYFLCNPRRDGCYVMVR